MRIKIDGRDYSFKFQHNTGNSKGKLEKEEDSQVERGTVCRVFNEVGDQVTYGVSNVHPKDNFCKEKGRKIALSRAIKSWDKAYREQVWNEYRTWGSKDRW